MMTVTPTKNNLPQQSDHSPLPLGNHNRAEIKLSQTHRITVLYPGFMLVTLLLSSALAQRVFAQSSRDSQTTTTSIANHRAPSGTLARIFWQDEASGRLRWGDLGRQPGEWFITNQELADHPALDNESQSLVQMQQHNGLIVVGVRDSQDGSFQSGWFAVDSGAHQEEHGDHFHWRFHQAPRIVHQVLDDRQGNPAHLYLYDGQMFLANDQLGGFTRISPDQLLAGQSTAGTFFVGGGGHITLAAAENKVAYSTWIDRQGENQGRVDVVDIASGSNDRNYSIQLPSGGLHGATTVMGKVFFAPSDGICMLQADLELSQSADSKRIKHWSLGSDDSGKPLRTGAFTTLGSRAMFTTGTGSTARLCWINANAEEPDIEQLMISVDPGSTLSTPIAATTRLGTKLAFLFQESRHPQVGDRLTIVNLDPNRDDDWSDAHIERELLVGNNAIRGHSGHHDLVIFAGGRLACFTNPGDGSISVLSLSDLEIVATLALGGTPGRLVAIGD
jgi:hypothetical protein